MPGSHSSIKTWVDFAIHALKFGGGFCFFLADPWSWANVVGIAAGYRLDD
jgi:hypothetical protein